MARIYGDPTSFAQDALVGFCDQYPDYVRRVPGGVVRSTATPQGKVALVVGGGSGHYPAFVGYVGPGLADGAVAGDVFASPSTRQVMDVSRAASRGGGVVLGFGNYAGDVLNFGAAAERLTAEGIPTHTIAVTDDIASASPDETAKRRGIAGDVMVFKMAGAAAEAGYDLDGVVRISRASNDNTRSLGVAFAGVTLPGRTDPLFTVPAGTMGVGLGIHGEAGVSEQPLGSAEDLARLLVGRVVDEAPAGAGSRVAVLLNGLGATKYEELFVLWRYVAPMLRDTGLELVAPECGEFVTSLDMAGCSLTVCWLDDELEQLWLAPAQTPAFRRGAAVVTERAAEPDLAAAADTRLWAEASPESAAAAERIVAVLAALASALSEAEEELGRIDAQAGDGDHGHGMARGSAAAHAAAAEARAAGAGAASVLTAASDAWADRAGGTSGALWGVALRAWSGEFSDAAEVTTADVVRGARAALDAVMKVGGAKIGDKTLVDAFEPFVTTLEAQANDGRSLAAAWEAAAQAATRAARDTAGLTPRLGRARPLAERSLGHPDAGAISLALCARTVGAVLQREETQNG